MVWVINSVPKVVQVGLGSDEMLAAKNVYLTSEEAYEALQKICLHKTKLGIRSTGRVFCSDCSKAFN